MMGKSDGVDHPPPRRRRRRIDVSTVPIGDAVGHHLLHILLAVGVGVKVMIVTAMKEEGIKRSPHGEAKVRGKNGVIDRLAKGKADVKTTTAEAAVMVIVGKKRRRKSLKVIDLKGIIDHHLYRHHLPLLLLVGTMIQMCDDLPFQGKRLKCTLTKPKMIW